MTVDVFENPPLEGREPVGSAEAARAVDTARLRRIVTEDYGFLWRSLRRLGVPEADADDGVQRVLGVLARRLHEVAVGVERAFLFQTALRVASEMRRSQRRSRLALPDGDLHEPPDEAPGPDAVLEQRQARRLLDEAITALDIDLAAVFVLFELEEMTTSRIAELLEIPPGTVSTRLRRAREEFKKVASRLRARDDSTRRNA
ncbi:MAG: sigma-70 family RNA polymerase sigma factor [Labilithrix sp.]|nr:sigma-70 family RNA polymerase sigma factor [Labilithrix sp.]